MPPTEREIADDLESREYADLALNRYGSLRPRYQSFHDELERVYRVYGNDWQMIWPDGLAVNADPMVPNMVRIPADDRARAVSATPPTPVCFTDGPGDKSRAKADKLERIVSGWFDNANIRGHKSRMWAYDAMGGLAVCKVLPDFTAASPEQRFPTFERLSPVLSYPDPIFTSGPFVDSFIYAYESTRRDVSAKYPNAPLEWPEERSKPNEKVRVIEYYDETWVMVVAEQLLSGGRSNAKPRRQTLVQEKHLIGKCPIVIAATPTTAAQCARTGLAANLYGADILDSPAGQYNYLQGGNAQLQSETAKTWYARGRAAANDEAGSDHRLLEHQGRRRDRQHPAGAQAAAVP